MHQFQCEKVYKNIESYNVKVNAKKSVSSMWMNITSHHVTASRNSRDMTCV